MREGSQSQRMVPALLMLMMATATPAATGSNRRKPHIIFILADDMGWADTSFHGSPQIPTPNLDALAADGVVLNNHYAQSVCSPSRAALLTGLYPLRFVAYWMFDVESHANEPRLRQPRRLSQPRRGLRHTHGHLQRIVRLRLLVQRAAADRCLRCLLHGHLLEEGENHHQGSRRLRATLDTMDQATGAVVEALYEKGMLEDAVIIFSSDNGPDPIGMGSSWPLRGSKQSLWEGGVRVPAFIWSPLLDRSGAEGRVSWDLMHMVDWMPTLYQAAGGKIDDLGPIDGVSQWGTLSRGEPPARQELLHGFDPTDGSGAYRSGRYKLVVTPSNKSWKNGRFPPAGNVSSNIDVDQLTADSAAAKTLAKLYSATETRAPSPEWRRRAALSCKEDEQGNFNPSDSLYLFDVLDDPCERKNLASERSDLVESLMKKLNAAASIAVPPGQSSPEPEAYPEYNNCTWGPRQDIVCNKNDNMLLCPTVETSVAAEPFYGSFFLTLLLSLCLVYVLRHLAS